MNISGFGGKGAGNRSITVSAVLLVVFLVIMIYSFVFVAIERGHDTQYLSLIGEQRILTQQVATNALTAGQGNLGSFAQLKARATRVSQIQGLLKSGDPKTGMPGTPAEIRPQFKQVEGQWSQIDSNIKAILDGRVAVSNVKGFVDQVNEYIPQLMKASEEVVSTLVEQKAPNNLVFLASRQLMLAQRVENNLNKILSGRQDAASSADRFGRDATLFGRVLEGMLKGSNALGIKKVKNNNVRSKLREVAVLFSAVSQNVGGILEASPELFAVSSAVSKSEGQINTLVESIKRLDSAFKSYTARLDVIFVVGIFAGLLALTALVFLLITLIRDTRKRLAEQTESGKRNQRAILRLLDELTNLAEGDLSAHATVTEDITGAIADSVNYAIDALRSLVTTINETSYEVSDAADKTQSTAMELADASDNQAREIVSASASITDMANAMTQVSDDADKSSEFALQSVDIATKGLVAVRSTIDGMASIREQIQETSKRIKRLGESSQEIGDIIGLITEIADQTNILALNAAIQAASAGDAGRGFAVVADEVQRLAERSSNAAKQVEGLVRTIQADTNEAIASMEQSTAGVVNGAKLAENAGSALDEIEVASKDLAGSISKISEASRDQAVVAKNITDTMVVIQEITVKTSEGTIETANSIGLLASLSEKLRDSVSGFKLPEQAQNDDGSMEDMMNDTTVINVEEDER